MRRYLLMTLLPSLSVLLFACGEHGVEVTFPSEPVNVIPVEGEPSFAEPHWLPSVEQVSVRVHGIALAPLSGRAPSDRDALERVAVEAVRAHEHRVTQSLLSHVKRTVVQNDALDMKWQSTRVMRRGASMKIESALGRVRYAYELYLQGPPDLFSLLAPHQRAEPGFELEIGDALGEGEASRIDLKLTEHETPDAFLPVDAMGRDGAIDIAVHMGDGGVSDAPATARVVQTGLSLLAKGWKHPSTANYGALKPESQPFTRAAQFGGKSSELRVTLVSESSPVRGEVRRLSSALIHSLTERDIVILRDLTPALERAVVSAMGIAEGTEGEMIAADAGAQLVVVHRTSSEPWSHSAGSAVRATVGRDLIELRTSERSDDAVLDGLVAGLTLTDATERHVPLTVGGLHRLAGQQTEMPLHLSVWGLEDNPRLNPYGSASELCGLCAGPGACGAAGNLCVVEDELSRCGVACAEDTACPQGYRCATVTTDTGLSFLPRQCVPRAGHCGP